MGLFTLSWPMDMSQGGIVVSYDIYQCGWHHSLGKGLKLYNSEEVKPSTSRKVSMCYC